MGDYDKIRRPSLQDGVGLLTRFSPRDDPVQLPSSTSVAIQLPRQDCQAAGVTRLGTDGCFLYFDVVTLTTLPAVKARHAQQLVGHW